jgi:hypothetical protein
MILSATALLAVTPAAAQSSGGFALDFLTSLLEDDHSILLLPEPGGQDQVFTSLESLGSFGMFENTNDFAYNNEADLALLRGDESTRHLKMPSVEDEGDARVIFTNLTNYAIEDFDAAGALTLGTVSKVGPGNLSIGLGYRAFESEFNCTSTGTGSCGGGAGSSDYGKFEMPALDLALGYGFKLSEKSSLGFSFRYGSGEENLEEWQAPTTGTPILETSIFEWMSYRFGAAFRMDMSEKLSWNVRAFVSSTTPEASFSDEFNMADFKLTSGTFGLMGRVNFYRENTDYEVFVSFAGSQADIDDAMATDTSVSPSFTEVWTDDFNRTDFHVGVRGLYRLGKADFAPAVVFGNMTADGKVRTAEQGQPDTFGANFDDTRNQLYIPFSVRYHFTERFAAGAGAQWTWLSTEDERTEELLVSGSEGSFTDTFKDTQTFTDYRLFMRYGGEHLSAQLLFANELDNFFISATGPQPGSITPSSSSDRNFDRNNLSIDTVAVMVNVAW